jgi:hypothetical protein
MKGKNSPIFHSFVVFSIVSDDGLVLEKFSQCNNCGVIHRVYDICKSELLKKEQHASIQTILDISLSLPTELNNILTTYQCDIAIWEHIQFIFSNKKWGEHVILTRETEDGVTNGKRLVIAGQKKFKIEPITFSEVV